jgi:small conductance mechanosensitive channel
MGNYINETTVALLTTYAMRLAGLIVLLLIAWIIAGWTRRATQRGLERAQMDPTLRKFFANLARYTVLVIAVLACLGIFGVQTTSFAALIAAAGLAIGLAFQGTLSNFAAGAMLLTFRPFKAGDLVSVAGHLGIVDEIELFTTAIDTLDNRRLIVPNSAIFGSTIENLTYHDVRRVDVEVGTEYRADLDKVRRVLEKVVEDEPSRVPERNSHVLLAELGESSINWQLRVWARTDQYWDVRQRVTRSAKYALDQAGISIPFPQRDVHFDPEFVERK